MMEKANRRDLVDNATLRALCVASDRAGAVQTGSHVGAALATEPDDCEHARARSTMLAIGRLTPHA